LCAGRILPGGEALIEVRSKVANQRRLQGRAQILAAQVAEQVAQRPFIADALEQLPPQRCAISRICSGAGRRVAQRASRRPKVSNRRTFSTTVDGRGGQQALTNPRVEIGLQSLAGRLLLDLPAPGGG
jgi:hypothetical protein